MNSWASPHISSHISPSSYPSVCKILCRHLDVTIANQPETSSFALTVLSCLIIHCII